MIIVYSSSSCPWCLTVKKYLESVGASYTEINVSKDWNAANEMIEKTGQRSVPVIDINGEFIVGFDKNKIDSLLATI